MERYVVTWAIGHLVALAQPHEIRQEWRSWSAQSPAHAAGIVAAGGGRADSGSVRSRAQNLHLPAHQRRDLRDGRGARGRTDFPLHLRGRRLFEASAAPLDFVVNSGSDRRRVSKAARLARIRSSRRCRARPQPGRLAGGHEPFAGLRLLACHEEFSVGRVQTPTLAMLVQRELEIRNFVPEDYRNVVATFSPPHAPQRVRPTKALGFGPESSRWTPP